MSQIAGKWIETDAVNDRVLDNDSTFTMAGLLVNGDATVTGNFVNNGRAILADATIQNLYITDTDIVSTGDATFGGNLSVGQNATIVGTLFGSDATFTGNLDVQGTIDVDATVVGDFRASGDGTFGGGLSVAESATVAGTIFGSDATFTGNLDVQGTIDVDATVVGDFRASGDGTFGGGLSVGAGIFGSDASFSGDASFSNISVLNTTSTGSLSVTSNATVTGTLTTNTSPFTLEHSQNNPTEAFVDNLITGSAIAARSILHLRETSSDGAGTYVHYSDGTSDWAAGISRSLSHDYVIASADELDPGGPVQRLRISTSGDATFSDKLVVNGGNIDVYDTVDSRIHVYNRSDAGVSGNCQLFLEEKSVGGIGARVILSDATEAYTISANKQEDHFFTLSSASTGLLMKMSPLGDTTFTGKLRIENDTTVAGDVGIGGYLNLGPVTSPAATSPLTARYSSANLAVAYFTNRDLTSSICRYNSGLNEYYAIETEAPATISGFPAYAGYFSGNIKVTGDSTFNNINLSGVVTGDTSFQGGIEVEGDATFKADMFTQSYATIGSVTAGTGVLSVIANNAGVDFYALYAEQTQADDAHWAGYFNGGLYNSGDTTTNGNVRLQGIATAAGSHPAGTVYRDGTNLCVVV